MNEQLCADVQVLRHSSTEISFFTKWMCETYDDEEIITIHVQDKCFSTGQSTVLDTTDL